MEQKNFKVINIANCKYVYLPEQQKLMSMELMETEFDLESGGTVQRFRLGGNCEFVELPLDSQFYVSEESFRLGAPMPVYKTIETLALVNIMDGLFIPHYVKEDETGPFVWIYENGEAAKWRLEEHAKKVLIGKCDGIKNRVDCQLPEEYYMSPDEVYKYNDYTVQDKDGKTEVHEGVYKRLMLTDEQNALLDKLQAVINECSDAGIAIEYDLSPYHLVAFNKKNIKEYYYEPVYDEEKEAAYELDLSRAGRVIKGVGDVNTEDGSLQFVIEKPKND